VALVGVDQAVGETVLYAVKALPHVRYVKVLRF
jgi:hypothetical protein